MSSGALFLGVSDEGVAFCDANKVLFPRLSFLCASCCPWLSCETVQHCRRQNVQLDFKYNKISSWAATKTNFAFVVGDIHEQQKYVFRTEQVTTSICAS